MGEGASKVIEPAAGGVRAWAVRTFAQVWRRIAWRCWLLTNPVLTKLRMWWVCRLGLTALFAYAFLSKATQRAWLGQCLKTAWTLPCAGPPDLQPRLWYWLTSGTTPASALGSATFLVVVGVVVWHVWREFWRDVIVIEPFSVPKKFEEAGMTPRMMASRIGSAVDQLERKIQRSTTRRDAVAFSHHEATLDIEFPSTKIGLRTLVEFLRHTFNRHVLRISGDFAFVQAAKKPVGKWIGLRGTRAPEPASVEAVRVGVYGAWGRKQLPCRQQTCDKNELDALVDRCAEMVLELANPRLYGQLLVDRGELNRAIEVARKMIDFDGNKEWMGKPEAGKRRKDGHSLRGWVHIGLKQWDEADAEFKKILALDRRFAAAYSGLGIVLHHKKDYTLAIHCYKTSIRKDSRYAGAFSNWGAALYDQKKYPEACEKCERATQINPEFADAINNWGNALFNQEKYTEACEKYERATQINPEYADAFYNWGNAMDAQEKYPEACEKYERATRINPDYANAFHNWGLTLDRMGDKAGAVVPLRVAHRLRPDDFGTRWLLWRVLRELADMQDDATLAQEYRREADELFSRGKNAVTLAASK